MKTTQIKKILPLLAILAATALPKNALAYAGLSIKDNSRVVHGDEIVRIARTADTLTLFIERRTGANLYVFGCKIDASTALPASVTMSSMLEIAKDRSRTIACEASEDSRFNVAPTPGLYMFNANRILIQ